MSQTNERVIKVVLWGDSQTGKTTALAAYLCDVTPSRVPRWMNKAASETQGTLDILGETWNDLMKNRLPVGTDKHQYYDVRARNQALVRFRDMRGGNARGLSHDDREALRTAPAALFFVEWPAIKTVFDKIAIGNAFRAKADNCKTVLVITKVERFLSPLEMQKFMDYPHRAARGLGLPREFMDILSLFPADSVFPITVYGYSENDYPALYHDEFGRVVPWGIRPWNVAAPFDQILHPLLSESQGRGNP
jgi:hypothetical protein